MNFRQYLESIEDDEYEVGDDEDTPHSSYANTQGARRWGNQGAGILPIARTTGRILLNFRSKYVNEGQQFGVWGGKVDEDNLEMAARREFIEETEYSGNLQLIPAYRYSEPGFIYQNFIGIVDKEFDPELNWESEGFKWVSIQELSSVRPMHFGLVALLRNSGSQIQAIVQGIVAKRQRK
jgi:8-oxo-dGTP pyrophosphatase MutT (NUDIX family)